MASNAREEGEYIELTIKPIPPDTVSSVHAEIRSVIAEALREAGQEQLLASGEFQVEVERPLPSDEILKILLLLLSGIALETYKYVLRRLEARYLVVEKRQSKRRAKRAR